MKNLEFKNQELLKLLELVLVDVEEFGEVSNSVLNKVRKELKKETKETAKSALIKSFYRAFS